MKRCTKKKKTQAGAFSPRAARAKRQSSAPSIMKYGKRRWLGRPRDLSLTYTTPQGAAALPDGSATFGEGKKKKKITTNTDDRAHFRHNEIKLGESRAIKLPSGIMVMPTIGCKRTEKKKSFRAALSENVPRHYQWDWYRRHYIKSLPVFVITSVICALSRLMADLAAGLWRLCSSDICLLTRCETAAAAFLTRLGNSLRVSDPDAETSVGILIYRKLEWMCGSVGFNYKGMREFLFMGSIN